MKAYRTYLTVTDPKHIVISDTPFRTGDKVEIVVMTVSEDNRKERVSELKGLFKETQSLPHVKDLTEDDILREVEAYRNGK